MNSHNREPGGESRPATGLPRSGLPSRAYCVRYVPQAPARLDEHVLACIGHGCGPAKPGGDPRRINVELPLLHGPAAELWTSAAPVRHGRDGPIGYADNGEVLMGQLFIAESALEHLDREVFHAYAVIDGFLRRHGYPAWLRVWNYIGHINRGEGDAERYRQFTLGRYKALALKSGFETELPAATAIGTHAGGMQIYFLAGRVAGQQVENPRQVSAFNYPRQYGPRSPSFSRGMLLPWAGGAELMVSGTASIVGHQTLHVGDPPRQLDEALRNIEALLAHAGSTHCAAPPQWQAQVVKAYVRDTRDAPAALARLQRWAEGAAVVVMLGDICRGDLAVEVEATFVAAPAP